MFAKCVNCGSENLESGKLEKLDNLHFIPTYPKFLVSTSKVALGCQACTECGYIMLMADPQELVSKVASHEEEQ
jgi:DNA-directed RNA polymerase subunit RPC12/RpoP